MKEFATLPRIGLFLIGGLAVQGLTLFWVHPLSFILFLVAVLIAGVGVVLAIVRLFPSW